MISVSYLIKNLNISSNENNQFFANVFYYFLTKAVKIYFFFNLSKKDKLMIFWQLSIP